MAGFTVAQLEAIEAAIASGTLTVEYNGIRTTYQDLDQLLKLRDLMRGELEEAGLLTAKPRRSYAAHSKD